MRHKPQDALEAALRRQQAGAESRADPEMTELLSVVSRLKQLTPPEPDADFVEQLGALLELRGATAPAHSSAEQGHAQRSWPWFQLSFASAAIIVLLLVATLSTNRFLSVRNTNRQSAGVPATVAAHMQHAEELLLQAAHPEASGTERSQLVVAYREAVLVVRAELEPAAEETWLTGQLQSLQQIREDLDATTFQQLSSILEPLETIEPAPTTGSTASVETPAASGPGLITVTTTLSVTRPVLTQEIAATLAPTQVRKENTPLARSNATPTRKAEQTATATLVTSPTPTREPPPTSPPASPTTEVLQPVPPPRPTRKSERPTPRPHPTARPTPMPPALPTPTQTEAQPIPEVPVLQTTAPEREHPTEAAGSPEEKPTKTPDEPPGNGPPEEHPTSQAPEHPTQAAGPPEEKATKAPGEPPGNGPPDAKPTKVSEHPTKAPDEPSEEKPTKAPDDPPKEKPTQEPKPEHPEPQPTKSKP